MYLKVGAGIVWHDFVLFCLNNNYGGIENLILIPGTVGAAPIQNIGAYGVSLQDVFVELTVLDTMKRKLYIFKKQYCNFGYRNSIFKEKKNQYIIVDVTFKLALSAKHQLHTQYGTIQNTIEKISKMYTIQSVGQAIMQIRKNKLPDPKKLGNAGSFFQNPLISQKKYILLKKKYSHIKGYEMNNNKIKISAAELIKICGWQEKTEKDVGIYHKHSLVLVNYGKATGQAVYQFAQKIQQDIKKKMDIDLLPEVNIW